MTPTPQTRPCRVDFEAVLGLSASERGLRIADCARTMDCRRIRRSAGLLDYGFFQNPGRIVSG
eukprot:3134136-Alexandrium_andersonii.AAC.1